MTMQNQPAKKTLNSPETPPLSLIALLQNMQKKHGCLQKDAMKETSRVYGIPLSRLFAVATFYNAFSLEPQGKHIISVCLGTACHVKKGESLGDTLARKLGLQSDEGTTADGMFTLKKVRCLGCCSMAPVVKIDDVIYGHLTQAKIEKVLASWKKGSKP